MKRKWILKKINKLVFVFWFGLFSSLEGLPHKNRANKNYNKSDKISYNLVVGLPNIYLAPMSEKIGHTWVNGMVWDKELIQKFYLLLKQHREDFTILDLGAQTGAFSLLSKFFPFSQWYAFEPIQEAATTLMENLKINNIHNVCVEQKAVADFVGNIKLKMPEQNHWGLSTIGSKILRFETVYEREVDCITLDEFVKNRNIKRVDFIKIDTEGAELFILKGALNLIRRDRPIILMEYNQINMQQCEVQKEEIEDFLNEVNYKWELISSEDILCTPL